MQIVSNEDNLHEMSKSSSGYIGNISICRLLTFLYPEC